MSALMREAHRLLANERWLRALQGRVGRGMGGYTAEPSRRTVEACWQKIADQHEGVTLEDVLGRRRRGKIVDARWALWRALDEVGKYSYASIGRATGYNHTSVLYGVGHLRFHGEKGEKRTPRWIGVTP